MNTTYKKESTLVGSFVSIGIDNMELLWYCFLMSKRGLFSNIHVCSFDRGYTL